MGNTATINSNKNKSQNFTVDNPVSAEQKEMLSWINEFKDQDTTVKVDTVIFFRLLSHRDPIIRQAAQNCLEACAVDITTPKGINDICGAGMSCELPILFKLQSFGKTA